jgi:hypothetical protein
VLVQMGFKKVIKRIVALGTGASMVGATFMGAMAADLAQYPSQYISDGKFTGVLVVGDTAAAEDVIGVSDIAVSLQFAATKPVSVSAAGGVTAEGDAWKVGTSTKILELSETNVETIRNITSFIDDSELDALASGTVSSPKGDAPYNQYLYLLGPAAETGLNTGFVQYIEDDQDVTADFLYFKSGEEIGRYLLEFTTALESDVDDSAGAATTTGLYLTDIEDTELNMFGKSYTVVQARRTSATGNNIKLVLMGGAVKDTLLEGATKTYDIGGTPYEVTLDFVDADSTKLTINGEGTRDMLDGETDKMSDGITVGISEILYQAYAGGVHSVSFFLGAQKMELKDTDITDVDQSNGLKIDDETIDGAFVVIEGTDDNSTYKINRIHINMTADADYFVPAGGKLSENPELDEPQVLFTSSWDIEYKGLAEQLTETIEIASSGNKKYVLKFKDGDGEEVKLPLAEAVGASSPVFGEKDKALINQENRSIKKHDYVVLTDSTENRGERKTYVLQYKGGDKVSADSPVLKFKNMGNGETIEQTWTNPTSVVAIGEGRGGLLATLKIGGADYRVYNASSVKSNDFDIMVDLDSSGTSPDVATNITITTWYGMEIDVENASRRTDGAANGLSVNDGIVVSFKTPDNSRDGASTLDNVESLQATDFVVNVTADSNTKVALSTLSAHTPGQAGTSLSTLTPDGETDVSYAYTSYGAFITHKTPSSEPAILEIEYPKAQREALVYVTAKGTTFTQTAASTTGAVSIQRIDVGATKLASEVPNINAVNSIIVGGPCANAAAAEVMGNPADCAEGFTPGVGKVVMYDVNGNVAMLVAGYAAADTRNAAAVVSNYGDYTLTGAAMEVTKVGSTLTVAEPSTEAAADDAAADTTAADDTTTT